MCGKYLEQGNTTVGADGFRIPGGPSGTPRSRVSITNGTVRDFTRAGISVGRNITIQANTACDDIIISDMTIAGCDIRGIEFEGSTGAGITNSKINNTVIANSVTSASGDFGIYLLVTDNIKLENCQIVDSGNASIIFRALQIEDSTKCIAKNVAVCECLGASLVGFNIDNSVGCLLTNCLVVLNLSTSFLTGFVLTGGAMVTGNNLTLCSALNNIATSGPLIGFDLQTLVTRNSLNQCIASNNLCSGTNATLHCIGFNLDQVDFCSLIQCRAQCNCATADSTFNIAAGFHIGTTGGAGTGVKDTENCECFAANNQGFNDERSFGFRVASGPSGNVNNTFISNMAIRNGVSTPYAQNQIVSNAGIGSSPGGVPSASIITRTTQNINTSILGISNVRVI